jgi:hypothetical protein
LAKIFGSPPVVTLDELFWLLFIFTSFFCVLFFPVDDVMFRSSHIFSFLFTADDVMFASNYFIHTYSRFQKYENNEQKVIMICLQNVHQGFPRGTLLRFLKAREWSVPRAQKMVRR